MAMDFSEKFNSINKPELIDGLKFTPYSPRESSKNLGVKWQNVVMLYDEGFLSFDPETTLIETEAQSWEWDFLVRLLRGGCNRDQLKDMLKNLEAPYCYDIRKIYYDWALKQWRRIPRLKTLAAFVEDAISDTFDDDDINTLWDLYSSVESAIEVMQEEINSGLRRDKFGDEDEE